ncbi:MAG: DNA mismatch repair endonuclease MutL [Chloroflexi bacterium]|nr:DNA mismatch repair endonuclease MutL [Chloroflexota bacterium]
MPIRLLPPELTAKIAAGEVVERPASVVKELLENALDADARSIAIEIEAAGTRRIRVTDDGRGIASVEITLALERHATSKLAQAEDLEHITTLGFRGEALASIASVARVTLASRSADEARGAQVHVEGGSVGAVQPVGAPPGTTVMVEDLFFAVPARLKFLKSELTERRQIELVVSRYALAYPQVRFALDVGGRPVLRSSGSGDRREALASVFGLDEARQMLELQRPPWAGEITVSGFASPPSLTRSNRKEIVLFVNGRWIQDAALTAAVVQAYHTLLMVGRYPMAAIFITLPTEEVDVNVHPAKSEVRFRSAERVFSAVQRTVRSTLMHSGAGVAAAASDWSGPGWVAHAETSAAIAWPDRSSPRAAPAPDAGAPPAPGSLPASALLAHVHLPLLRVIGQVGATYIVAEGPDGLYLIDQHAAHERVLFEQFLREQDEHRISQPMLAPVVFEVPAAQAGLLQAELETLRRLGFDIQPFGGSSFQVRAVPHLVQGADPVQAVRAVVEEFEEDETPLAREKERRLIARICKRVAVKGGQSLTSTEQEDLVSRLESCDSARTCPHGRPTMIHLSVELLERQFGRRG